MQGDQATGDTEMTFGERSAACADCRVDDTNTIDTMTAVLVGDRDPEEWWCEQHIEEYNEKTGVKCTVCGSVLTDPKNAGDMDVEGNWVCRKEHCRAAHDTEMTVNLGDLFG